MTARKVMGGFAILAEVLDIPDVSSSDPKILLFYAAPNPVTRGRGFKLFWTTANVGHVRVMGPSGFDSGILVSDGGGYYEQAAGVSIDSTFVLVALDNNGDPIRVNNQQLSSSLRIVTR